MNLRISKNYKIALGALLAGLFLCLPLQQAVSTDSTQYWMKLRALDKFERTFLADQGFTIEIAKDDYVIALGSEHDVRQMKKMGYLIASSAIMSNLDFPQQDSNYHNYTEMRAAMDALNKKYPTITTLFSIGKSLEGRDIMGIRISEDIPTASQKPGIIFMGGHHAREHLSVDTPLRLVTRLLEEYSKGNSSIKTLIATRDIHVIPEVNPDGSEFDIATGRYQTWRKNRRANANGTVGVDLNRNYSFGWGGQGASSNPSSDTYRGPNAFSEPETLAIKNYVETNKNLNILLSFHTFSQLVLYPFGHTYDKIPIEADYQVHKTMAETMAKWNGYKPQQSSELYIASGDTTDWSYGEHKIISFTFELDPANNGMGAGGFYPGDEIIESVVNKNWQPFLYLIEYADNPYRVINGTAPVAPPVVIPIPIPIGG